MRKLLTLPLQKNLVTSDIARQPGLEPITFIITRTVYIPICNEFLYVFKPSMNDMYIDLIRQMTLVEYPLCDFSVWRFSGEWLVESRNFSAENHFLTKIKS